MTRYIQKFFRHKILICAPLIVALVVGLGYQLRQPRKWMAGGTLWADAAIPSDSTIASAANPTPASQEAQVLSEFLHTRDFLTKVGQRSPWAHFLATHPQPADDAILGGIAKSVSIATPGPQLLSVSATGTTPNTTLATTKAVIDTFINEIGATRQSRGQDLVNYYKQQVATANTALSAAQAQLNQYLQAHPGASDATATQLAGSFAQAQQQYAEAAANLAKANLDTSQVSSSSQLRVIDQPILPLAPQARKKKIIFAGIGSLLAGAVISLLTLTLLVACDTSARGEGDIEEALGVQVVGTIRQLPSRRWRTGKAS